MSQPIRVLQVIGQMDRGGAETMIMNLYREIDRSKVQFDFVVHTNQTGSYDEEILALGGKLFRVPRFNGINILRYKREWKKIISEHDEYKIIHGHIGSSAAIYLNIAKKRGIFTIAHSHSSGTKPTLKGKLYAFFSYPTRHIADLFLGCSIDAGIKRFGNKVVNSKNFRVLKNAIKANIFTYSKENREKIRSKLNFADKFVIGHIGRFDIAKNQSFLIDVFSEIHKNNENALLILIGDGELRESMQNKVNGLGLSSSVIFTGVRSDISELLQLMDVFVFPSLYEGLGIATIEAQAAGLHCVVSESIPQEAFVTDLIESISLKASTETWAKVILKYAEGYERRNTYEEIKVNGYDICDTAKWLEAFYLKVEGEL